MWQLLLGHALCAERLASSAPCPAVTCAAVQRDVHAPPLPRPDERLPRPAGEPPSSAVAVLVLLALLLKLLHLLHHHPVLLELLIDARRTLALSCAVPGMHGCFVKYDTVFFRMLDSSYDTREARIATNNKWRSTPRQHAPRDSVVTLYGGS